MISTTGMPPRLLRAYRQTRYEAAGILIFVGRRSSAMDALMRQHGARAGVFVTAWNPHSRLMPIGWNHRRQRALLTRLRRRIAIQAEGRWRRWQEAHVLVLAEPAMVTHLAHSFRQNAVVVVRHGRETALHAVAGAVWR